MDNPIDQLGATIGFSDVDARWSPSPSQWMIGPTVVSWGAGAGRRFERLRLADPRSARAASV
ncbi:hypothetical protein AB0H43_13310 [Hamadaea sp. NPDC050747]|uniref:hypothetical protein n=1 Tax=Hamadaea sp. NPDC050747 TaxID=3155789 RepID=UPI0033C7E59E